MRPDCGAQGGGPKASAADAATAHPAHTCFAERRVPLRKILAQPDGPRIGALAFNGWDTHVNEGVLDGKLAGLLGALDGAIAGVETSMGAAWSDTVVVLVTEFGRTARINGTDGTDHGTATVALLSGRALKGGRVIADWPGVAEDSLYQKRDLAPTTDLRAVLKGILRDHLRVDTAALDSTIFPGSAAGQSHGRAPGPDVTQGPPRICRSPDTYRQ